jgi:Na+/melibiose symporter-like transporter
MNDLKLSARVKALQTQRENFRYVQIDAIGIGLASAAAPFLPVFLTRLGATTLQVSLLTVMPGVTGLFLALVVGRFLQSRHNIVPWFSAARLLVISSYALTGIVPFIIPANYAITAILVIWAFATLPQTMVAIAFSVVMNAVAGPEGRYDLMSRRWSILGLTTAITVAIAGQILDRIDFPLDYQIVFLGLSLGGLISYYFSSRITLPDIEPPPHKSGLSLAQNLRAYIQLVSSERAFVSFAVKRFVYFSGVALAAPIFPIYFVRVVNASDAWIGFINTVQTALMLVGYYLWTRQSRRRGSRLVLLSTTLGMSLYPALVSMTSHVGMITLYAGMAGIFQAGLDLVFFDELMKTVPIQYSATFVSLAQSMQYLSSIAAPLMGTTLANQIGLSGALLVSAGLRFAGFGLFALSAKPIQRAVTEENHL